MKASPSLFRPFNPAAQKHRMRGQRFWQDVKRRWRALPKEQRTADRYIQIFMDEASLK